MQVSLLKSQKINDFIYIIILGVFCTAIAFSLSIEIMKNKPIHCEFKC